VNIPCSGRSRGRPRGVGPPPHISGKKEKITEGKKAGRASKTRQHPLPLNLRSGSPLSRFMLQKPE